MATPFERATAALVSAMHQVATADNPGSRKQLYEALLASTLMIPVPELPTGVGPGITTLPAGVQIQLVVQKDSAQVRITPAFTDGDALRNWDPNTPCLGLKAIDLFRFVVGTDIQEVIINPFDPIRKMIRPGGRIKRHEIEILAKGDVPSSVGVQHFEFKTNEQVLIGMPSHPPSDSIREWLRAKGATFPAVADLYFFQMARGERTSAVIGIGLNQDLEESERTSTVQTLGQGVRPQLSPDQFLDFMFLTGPFGEHVKKIGGLIYRRS